MRYYSKRGDPILGKSEKPPHSKEKRRGAIIATNPE